MPKITLTPAQQTILHILESLLISAMLTLIMGVYQFIATHGLDWPQLLTFASGSLIGSLALIYKSVTANPQFGQAVLDTLNEVKVSNSQLVSSLLPVLANLPAPGQQHPPVIVNLAQPTPGSNVNVSNAPVGTENIQAGDTPTPSAPPQKKEPTPILLANMSPRTTNAVGNQPQQVADMDTMDVPVPPGIDMTRHYGDSGLQPVIQPAQ